MANQHKFSTLAMAKFLYYVLNIPQYNVKNLFLQMEMSLIFLKDIGICVIQIYRSRWH